MTALLLLVALLLLLANGFFVAAEVALTAAAGRRAAIEELAQGGHRSARMARASLRELSFTLTGAQLGITMASLGLGFVAEPAIADLIVRVLEPAIALPTAALHAVAAALALSLVVFLHMVLAEMAPKNVAIADPIRTTLWVAVPFRLYVNAFRGVLWVLNGMANQVVKLLGVTPRNELLRSYTSDQIGSMLAGLRRVGALDASEHRLASRALRFTTRKVQDVMVPRSAVVTVPASVTPRDIERLVVATGHSRFPVYAQGSEDVRGFLHVKDLLEVAPQDTDRPLAPRLIRQMPVVPETAEIGQLLLEMQRRRSHMALVVDEHGTSAGIVTLEDLVEELVGEIRDEYDPAQLSVRRFGQGRYVVAGQLRPDELLEATGCRLPEGDFGTVAGFVMERLGSVPQVGQQVDHAGWLLRVRRMDGLRLTEVDVIRGAPSAIEPDASAT